MRWIILVCVIIFGLLLLFNKNAPSSHPSVAPTNTLTPTPQAIEINGYRLTVVEVHETDEVSLFLNLKDKLTLSGAKEKHNCRTVVNGGFYGKNDTPLGLFRTNGQNVNPTIKSALLNGFLLISADAYLITDEAPNNSFATALQSGPLLYLNGKPLPLRIRNDEPARRLVATITTRGRLFFFAFYNPDSTFVGPLLGDLPDILKELTKKMDTTFTDAINLDGGSASGMISDDINLGELTYVGSYFCIR